MAELLRCYDPRGQPRGARSQGPGALESPYRHGLGFALIDQLPEVVELSIQPAASPAQAIFSTVGATRHVLLCWRR